MVIFLLCFLIGATITISVAMGIIWGKVSYLVKEVHAIGDVAESITAIIKKDLMERG